LNIAKYQSPAAAAANAYSVACTTAGFNPDKVIANFAELVFYTAGTSVADGDHADKRSNAHDDSQHGQEAAYPVAHQGLKRFSNYGA
jgi:hypothetical protein